MKKTFATLTLALAMFSCSDDPAATSPEVCPVQEIEQYSLTGEEALAASQLSDFNAKFFRGVMADMPEGNLVCSPVSASMLLSMVANVVDDEVRGQIVAALGCEDINTLNGLARKTLRSLPAADSAATINFANGLWYHNAYTLNPAYEAVAAEYFATENFGMDFSQAAPVLDAINGWVNDKTEGWIPNIMQKLPDGTVAVLANAMYFKGAWANPFDPENTAEKPFYGKNGTGNVQMMYARDKQHYFDSDKAIAVKMQIGSGTLEAIFAMPKDADTDINGFIASDAIEEVCSAKYHDYHMEFSLPRFKCEPTADIVLNRVLKAMGIASDFTSSLFTETLAVQSETRQKATIEVNEQGAEGAAVTWQFWVALGDEPYVEPTPVANFNRPFVFMIREAATGNMLFAGRITDL